MLVGFLTVREVAEVKTASVSEISVEKNIFKRLKLEKIMLHCLLKIIEKYIVLFLGLRGIHNGKKVCAQNNVRSHHSMFCLRFGLREDL